MNGYGTGEEEPEHYPRLDRGPRWRRLRKPVRPTEGAEVGCTCITVLRLVARLLPRDEQTEWLEEQHGYLTDLPGLWSRWSWIVKQFLAMPRYVYTVRTGRSDSLRREPADMDAPPDALRELIDIDAVPGGMSAASPVSGLANRVDQLGAPAVRLAWAVAVLGSEATPALAASVAALCPAEAVTATDLLRSARIVIDGPMPKFVHPLIATTVYQSIPCALRYAMHDKAAWDLADAGHGPMVTARHLLETPPEGDRWVARQLYDAAREYQHRGAPEAARRYLRRALSELGLPALEKESE
ncbi:hypothetical protein ACFY0P_42835 [Streptomyces sp. NPDC001714]|uniref:hypothetical protein n=1 Tax=Streptomyces sp. NPDC001714 TaxID=3364603 RepID=UPI00369C2986